MAPAHSSGEEELAETLGCEQGAVSVCTISGEEGHAQPFPSEKAVNEPIRSVSSLKMLSLTFPNCWEASALVLHCRCKYVVIKGTDTDEAE